jgi:GTPase SAR1 family protein
MLHRNQYGHVCDKLEAKVQVWDTAGDPRMASMSGSYIKETDALIFVYAADDPQSLASLDT